VGYEGCRQVAGPKSGVSDPSLSIELPEVERRLARLYIAAEGAGLREEDRRKAVEVAAILDFCQEGLCNPGSGMGISGLRAYIRNSGGPH